MKCPRCGADVSDYQRLEDGNGKVFCPWCDRIPPKLGEPINVN